MKRNTIRWCTSIWPFIFSNGNEKAPFDRWTQLVRPCSPVPASMTSSNAWGHEGAAFLLSGYGIWWVPGHWQSKNAKSKKLAHFFAENKEFNVEPKVFNRRWFEGRRFVNHLSNTWAESSSFQVILSWSSWFSSWDFNHGWKRLRTGKEWSYCCFFNQRSMVDSGSLDLRAQFNGPFGSSLIA